MSKTMPSGVNNNDNAPFTSFELPVLDFNFGSITDGTDIPPPKRSTESDLLTPPETPSSRHDDSGSKTISGLKDMSFPINGNRERRPQQPAAETPPSPPEPGRPGSRIRLFSRASMNNNDADAQLPASRSVSMSNASRPTSQSGASVGEERKSKRSSGWFKRFMSTDSQPKRRSNVSVSEESTVSQQQEPTYTPPPMIPELVDLANDNGSLGADLFSHIK